jgi:hypothetical protein
VDRVAEEWRTALAGVVATRVGSAVPSRAETATARPHAKRRPDAIG